MYEFELTWTRCIILYALVLLGRSELNIQTLSILLINNDNADMKAHMYIERSTNIEKYREQ